MALYAWIKDILFLKHLLVYFQDTFSRAKTWVKELQRQASPNIVIALAGNKADLAAKRAVEHEVSSCESILINIQSLAKLE